MRFVRKITVMVMLSVLITIVSRFDKVYAMDIFGTDGAAVTSIADSSIRTIESLINGAWSRSDIDHVVWRSDKNNLARTEMLLRYSEVSPDIVFRRGLRPRNEINNVSDFVWDLNNYLIGFYEQNTSPFVSTTAPQIVNGVLKHWQPLEEDRREIEYLYEIFSPGGIDINKTFGEHSPFSSQREITFPGGIRPEFIRSVKIIQYNPISKVENLVKMVVNPNFVGVDGIPELKPPKGKVMYQWQPKPINYNTQENILNDSNNIDPMKRKGKIEQEKYPGDPNSKNIIANGLYSISSFQNNHLFLSVDKNREVRLRERDNQSTWDIFWYEAVAESSYIIKNIDEDMKFNGNVLTADLIGSKENVLNNFPFYHPETLNQSWEFIKTGLGEWQWFNFHNKEIVSHDTINPTNGSFVTLDKTKKKDTTWNIEHTNSRTLEDGLYTIETFGTKPSALTFDKQKKTSYKKEKINSYEQIWQFTYNDVLKAYSIKPYTNTNLCLDYHTQRKILTISENKNTPEQYWYIDQESNGEYFFRNYKYKNITIQLDSMGNAIGCYYNRGNQQKWGVSPYTSRPIEDGEYMIVSNIESLAVNFDTLNLDKERVTLNTIKRTSNDFIWKFSFDEKRRAYKIRIKSNPAYCFAWNSHGSDSPIIGATGDFNNQYWNIEYFDNGAFILRNYADHQMVATFDSGGKNLLYARENKYETNQLWYLKRHDKPIIPEGMYNILSKENPKEGLSLHLNNNTDPGKLVSTYLISDWILLYDYDDKSYSIKLASDPGISLVSHGPGAPIQAVENNKEHWYIEYSYERSGYMIRSDSYGSLVMEREANSQSNSVISNLQTNNTNNIWYFNRIYDD